MVQAFNEWLFLRESSIFLENEEVKEKLNGEIVKTLKEKKKEVARMTDEEVEELVKKAYKDGLATANTVPNKQALLDKVKKEISPEEVLHIVNDRPEWRTTLRSLLDNLIWAANKGWLAYYFFHAIKSTFRTVFGDTITGWIGSGFTRLMPDTMKAASDFLTSSEFHKKIGDQILSPDIASELGLGASGVDLFKPLAGMIATAAISFVVIIIVEYLVRKI